MPVAFKVATHDANPITRTRSKAPSPSEEELVSRLLLPGSVGGQGSSSCQEVLQSSYIADPWFRPSANGFIDTVMEAYSNHHHLIIRPDDIWCAILNQFNLYVNANAEALRSTFVAHQGQKRLEVWTEGSRYMVDFGWMANEMAKKIKENILDETLHDWVIPNFTTTTPNDVVICSVMLMSTLQKYFTYFCGLCCGIPSITLLGEQSDYLSILLRLDRFEEFGQEPTMFAMFLRPILKEFVNALDYRGRKDNPLPNPSFWAKMCHRDDMGSGPTFLCGWISAFSVWDKDGKWQGGDMSMVNQPVGGTGWDSLNRTQVFWGNLRYPLVDIDQVPKGYCKVPVDLLDNGRPFECMMIAGHVGMRISSSGNVKAKGIVKDTVQPAMEWFMFIQRSVNHPVPPIERPHGVYEQQQHEKIRQRDQQKRGYMKTQTRSQVKQITTKKKAKSSVSSWREILSKVSSPLQHVWTVKGKRKSSV
ncbi:hypothetical protein FRC17_002031 [Serendipita sp. 399]|nr:hypothetical protein FRC17_002031 [Serendipita sp. 399]